MLIAQRVCLMAAVIVSCAPEPRTESSQTATTAPVRVHAPSDDLPGISAPMARALNQYAPGFVRFRGSEYAPHNDTISRVDADFNGDNLPDVAVYGHDKRKEALLVVLSVADSLYRVYPLFENSLEPFPNGVSISLRLLPAGRLKLPELLQDSLTPAELRYPAVEVGFGQEGNEMYYWNGARFVKVLTGD
ncbi:MAG: hypothetical protein ACR2NS_10465 [Gemmatimonadaceae bacterium]